MRLSRGLGWEGRERDGYGNGKVLHIGTPGEALFEGLLEKSSGSSLEGGAVEDEEPKAAFSVFQVITKK